MAGSFLASYGETALGLYSPSQPVGFIASMISSIFLQVIYGLVKKK